MIDQINQLIAFNMYQFYNTDTKILRLSDFKDIENNPLHGAKMLAEIMLKKELIQQIDPEKSLYSLTEFGSEIVKKGGWIPHLEHITAIESATAQIVLQKPKANKYTVELIMALLIIAFLSFLILTGLK